VFSVTPDFAFVDSEQPVSNGAEQAGGCDIAACSLDSEACPLLCAEGWAAS